MENKHCKLIEAELALKAYLKEELDSNKYYTPEMDEFHIGFEYEYFYNDEWHKHYLDGTPIINNELDEFSDDLTKLSHAICRVKYLDKDDIESLGFKIIDSTHQFCKYEKHIPIEPNTDKQIDYWYIRKDNVGDRLFMYNYNSGWSRFLGEIKNISELKILLKQLGI